MVVYCGNTSVNTALNPKSVFPSGGPASGIRGPKAREAVCVPNLVTPETMGFRNMVVVFACQLKVISLLMVTPAPLFQLCAKKGCRNNWFTSLRSLSPAKDHNWFTKKP